MGSSVTEKLINGLGGVEHRSIAALGITIRLERQEKKISQLRKQLEEAQNKYD